MYVSVNSPVASSSTFTPFLFITFLALRCSYRSRTQTSRAFNSSRVSNSLCYHFCFHSRSFDLPLKLSHYRSMVQAPYEWASNITLSNILTSLGLLMSAVQLMLSSPSLFSNHLHSDGPFDRKRVSLHVMGATFLGIRVRTSRFRMDGVRSLLNSLWLREDGV